MQNSLRSRTFAALSLALLTAAATSGCGLASQLAYIVHGNPVEAKFAGLEGKRVAVVCLDANSLKGPGGEADAIAKAVSANLSYKVPDIEVVRQSEIADWMDNHNEQLTDYRNVGRGVKADMVVGIDLDSFSIHEGQTLLKGRAAVGVKVYDMQKDGALVYENPMHEIAWPESGARHVTESEAKFRTFFVHTLAGRISKDFYSYEKIEDYGLDAAYQGD